MRQAFRDTQIVRLITRLGSGRIVNSGPVSGLLASFDSWERVGELGRTSAASVLVEILCQLIKCMFVLTVVATSSGDRTGAGL